MQKLQLYIQGQRIDLFEDETVSLTQTIQNVKDVSKIFTDFSKSFTIPASKTNNKIFKHYYNFDIVGGFDGRKKVDAEIQLNSVTFKKGKVKLEGVGLKRNKAYSYKITFFGNTVTLKDLLGEDKLFNLSSLNSENYVYNSANNLTKLQADPSSTDLVIPIITHTDRLGYDSSGAGGITDTENLYYVSSTPAEGLYWNQLKPALRVGAIIDAIESEYGLTFSSDFFNSSNAPFHNLFLWLHRKKGVPKSTGENIERLIDEFTTEAEDIDTATEMINTNTLRVGDPSSDYLSFDITIARTGTNPYKLILYRNGVDFYTSPTITTTSVQFGLSDFSFDAGDIQIYLEAQSANLPITGISASYDIENRVGTKSYTSSSFTFQDEFQFILTQQLLDIKIIDFLSGLFKMFNLTAYVEDDGTIKVQTLDSFYATGTDYDITEFIDVESSQVDVALPYRQIDFRYQDTDYFLAKDHNERFGKQWGTEEYDSNGEKDLDGSIYKVELPFAHMKYERLIDINNPTSDTDVMYGWAVNESQEPRLGKPLLTYIVRQTSATIISFVDGSNTNNSITTYNIPSNSLSITGTGDLDNLNFYQETNEYTKTNVFVDTLFNEYYSTYISDVFNEKNRITKVTAYLPLRILLNYLLADIFIIRGNRYKINSIKTNLNTGKSDIELLNDL